MRRRGVAGAMNYSLESSSSAAQVFKNAESLCLRSSSSGSIINEGVGLLGRCSTTAVRIRQRRVERLRRRLNERVDNSLSQGYIAELRGIGRGVVEAASGGQDADVGRELGRRQVMDMDGAVKFETGKAWADASTSSYVQ